MSALLSSSKLNSKVIAFDILALVAIYFIPAISHKLSLPLYYLEPMRVALMFSILFTSFSNSIIIGLTLPLFSFAVSAHPVFIKTLLISSELVLNVVALYFISRKINNVTLSFTLSILISKIYYYSIKYVLISSTLLAGSVISTPIYIQGIMLIVFTSVFYIVNKKLDVKI